MVYALAVGAALISAVAAVMQRLGVETAPESSAMRIGLLVHAFRRGIWVAGFGLLLVQFVLQATALRFGQLSQVQPVLTLELFFLVAILAVFFRHRLGRGELAGAFGVVGGLAGFLLLAAPRTGHHVPSTGTWVVITSLVAGVVAVLVAVGRRGPRWWRAAALGTASAALFAYNASLTKSTTTLVTHGWGHVFVAWQPYALGATGALGFFLLQNALHAGPLVASRTMMVIVNPLAGIAIGVVAFQDHLRGGAFFDLGEVVALVALCGGAALLCRSPLVAGQGPEGRAAEMLRRPAVAEAPEPAQLGTKGARRVSAADDWPAMIE